MPTYTPNLGLTKPSNTEYVGTDEMNGNSDILDSVVGGMKYTKQTLTTTDTVNNKQITWDVIKYDDGRMEIESRPQTFTLPITTVWVSGWFRTNMSIQWIFPFNFVAVDTPQIICLNSSDLFFPSVPMNNSVLNMSGYRSYLYFSAPDPKTATVQIVCKAKGRWK